MRRSLRLAMPAAGPSEHRARRDSQGVRLLHRLSSALTARGATLVVVAPEESIAGDVLRITQMADLIEIRSSIDSA